MNDDDSLSSQFPDPVEVAVGKHRLALAPANLLQEEAFLSAMGALELERLLGPIAAVMELYGDKRPSTVMEFARIVRDLGPNIIGSIKPVLVQQLAPVARQAVCVLLDTAANRSALIKAGALTEEGAPIEADQDGAYDRCRAVRAWVKTNATLIQAIDVIRRTYALNGYRDLLGKLAGLLDEAGAIGEVPLQ